MVYLLKKGGHPRLLCHLPKCAFIYTLHTLRCHEVFNAHGRYHCSVLYPGCLYVPRFNGAITAASVVRNAPSCGWKHGEKWLRTRILLYIFILQRGERSQDADKSAQVNAKRPLGPFSPLGFIYNVHTNRICSPDILSFNMNFRLRDLIVLSVSWGLLIGGQTLSLLSYQALARRT